jgi:hypothetical protein
MLGGEALLCKIGHVSYVENYHVAVFTVHSEESAPPFTTKAAIDLTFPKVGEEVAVLGHKLKRELSGENSGTLGRELIFHFGVITGVTKGRGRMGQIFQFETTIPFLPGISGSPVLRRPEEHGTAVVCGVASFDLSEEAAFKDFAIPGTSTAAALWPAMELGFDMNVEGTPSLTLLADLANHKALDDRSVDIAITTARVDDKLRVVYEDKRIVPPEGFILEMNAPPESGSAHPVPSATSKGIAE